MNPWPWSGLRQKGMLLLTFLRWPLHVSLWPWEQALQSQIRWKQTCRSILSQAKRSFFQCESNLGQCGSCWVCDSTSGSLHKTSVREKSRGVYLPIGWVFPSHLMIRINKFFETDFTKNVNVKKQRRFDRSTVIFKIPLEATLRS